MEEFDLCMLPFAATADGGVAPTQLRPLLPRPRGSVLVVSPRLATDLRHDLALHAFDVATAPDAASALTVAAASRPDAVVVDLAGTGEGAARLLRRLLQDEPSVTAIVLIAPGASAIAVAAIGEDALLLPWPAARARLPGLLGRGLAEQRRNRALAYHHQRQARDASLDQLVGESSPMLRLKAGLRLLLDAQMHGVASTPAALLLRGEAGTGKLRVAKALHVESSRPDAPFIGVDAADLAAADAEATLFGIEHGAGERRRGLIEAADGGTLYLGEIGALRPALQERLADWLDRGTLRRVGGAIDVAVAVRLVAAARCGATQPWPPTSLGHRLRRLLSATQLTLPPLRERGADVDRLARCFIERQAAADGIAPPTLSRAARALLARHAWPGNVRELRRAIERALQRQHDGAIGGAQLGLDGVDPPPGHESAADLELRGLERDAMQSALLRARGNVCRAARLLGISRDTMRYRMGQHGLARHATTGPAIEAL